MPATRSGGHTDHLTPRRFLIIGVTVVLVLIAGGMGTGSPVRAQTPLPDVRSDVGSDVGSDV